MCGLVHEIRSHESGITAINPALDGLARNTKRQTVGHPGI
jgi:hypothetical protein